MHYYIFPTKAAWISSGSNASTTGISEKDQNYGKDQILELKKNFYNDSFDYPTRMLLKFDLNETGNSLSQSIVNGDITTPKFFLRLYESEGNSDIVSDYKISANPLSQSWDEGFGKFGDTPKVVNGVSWENRINKQGLSEITWSNSDGTKSHGGAYYTSGSGNHASQSFSSESPDINMDITDIVNNWLGGSRYIENHGILLKFSGSQETDSTTFGNLKFFSNDTNTIYSPKIEVRWDDHVACSGSNTGSLILLNTSGSDDNYLYPIGWKKEYRETEKVKFRIGARKRYIQKKFSTSYNTITGSYIPEDSGSYSIVDVATGETIVPFEDINNISYTKMSCDSTSNYFMQWMNTFNPDRVYKVIFKLKQSDGQEIIYDDDLEFIIKR